MSFLTSCHRLPFLLLLLLLTRWGFTQEQEADRIPTTLEALEDSISAILKETNTPAVGIALVDTTGPIWVTSLGKADVENDLDANEFTMFRIGSVSKMYASLAILKLQQEGKVSLTDKVRDLIPEIEFTNPWAEEHPILVEHLLEHTTGWDDIHLKEYAHNEPDPISLKAGLDYHPDSRVSRWAPGTRMSYCNSGPPTAAYIVEQITGQQFEDYIQEQFFDPMGMETMTYYLDENYQEYGASLYLEGEKQPYWHIIMRPSGSINASPRDMARMLSFFLHRGKADTVQIITEASLQRMETPATTSGAKAGLEYGYGLSNYLTNYESYVYRGHNGGVNGGLTDFSYLPQHGVGYAMMINSGNGEAYNRIIRLIRGYQTRDLPKQDPVIPRRSIDQFDDGYYVEINPRSQGFYFLERLNKVRKFWHENDTLYSRPWNGGNPDKYLAVASNQFASVETGKIEVVLADDPLAGKVIHRNMSVYQPTSVILVYGQIGIVILWILMMLGVVIFGIIWAIRYWRGKIAGGPNIAVRLWPLITTLIFVVNLVFIVIGLGDPFLLLGKMTFVSIVIWMLGIGYAIATLWSVWVMIKNRNAVMNRAVYWQAIVMTGLHLMVSIYLVWHDFIGSPSWT